MRVEMLTNQKTIMSNQNMAKMVLSKTIRRIKEHFPCLRRSLDVNINEILQIKAVALNRFTMSSQIKVIKDKQSSKILALHLVPKLNLLAKQNKMPASLAQY